MSIETTINKLQITRYDQQTSVITVGGILLREIYLSDGTARKVQVANSAPLNPDEGDVYVDSVENALFLAVDE